MTPPTLHFNSPMYLAGAFRELVIHRFAPHQETVWQGLHHVNQTPELGRTSLWVINGFDEETEAAGLQPRVVVEVGQDVGGRSDTLGNLGPDPHDVFNLGARDSWSITECDLELEVYGETRGETRQISEIIANTLIMARRPICAALRLRDMTPIVTQRTTRYKDGGWRGAVTTRLFRSENWLVIPRAPELREFTVELNMAQIVTQTNITVRASRARRNDDDAS